MPTTTGGSASTSATLTGAEAGPNFAEVDLAIDAMGGLLTIDPGGDVLIVTAAVVWPGTEAGGPFTFTGSTAS